MEEHCMNTRCTNGWKGDEKIDYKHGWKLVAKNGC